MSDRYAGRLLNMPGLLALALLLLVYPYDSANAQAQKVEGEHYLSLASLKEGSLSMNAELAEALSKWARAVEEGDSVEAIALTTSVSEIMDSLGSRNLIPAARFGIAVGRKLAARGDLHGAVVAGQNAVRFAPDYPGAHFFLAEAYFQKDRTDAKNPVYSLVMGVKAALKNRIERDRFISAVFKYIAVAIIISFLITFLTLLVANHNAIFADIAALLPTHPEGGWRAIIGALVLAVPLAVGGWLVFLMATPVFLWPYLRQGGKVVVWLFALFLIGAPNAMEIMAKGVTIQNADTYRALYLLSNGSWDYDTKRTLEAKNQADPRDNLYNFALGLLNKLAHNKQASLKAYDAILAANPNDIRALVNKGNVYFDDKNFDEAAKMYKQAIAVNPNVVEAHYNLSRAYTEMFKNKDSDAAYQRARDIAPEKVDSFRNMTESGETKVIDFTITAADLKRVENDLAKTTSAVARAWWDAYFGSLDKQTYSTFVMAFLVALAGVFVLWSRNVSHVTCSSCGVAFLPPIRLASSSPMCNQCVAAKSSRGGVSSAKKDKKRKEIREHQESKSRIASALDRTLPGVGRTYFNHPLSGLAFTFATSLFLVYAGMAGYYDIYMGEKQPGQLIGSHMVFLAGLAAYWAVMNTALKRDYY